MMSNIMDSSNSEILEMFCQTVSDLVSLLIIYPTFNIS